MLKFDRTISAAKTVTDKGKTKNLREENEQAYVDYSGCCIH
jgi:hypothetical protein